jgi:hypothetical protein
MVTRVRGGRRPAQLGQQTDPRNLVEPAAPAALDSNQLRGHRTKIEKSGRVDYIGRGVNLNGAESSRARARAQR